MNDQTSEVEDLERILIDECAEPIKISYAAIRHITKNFAQVIGDGGFGVVYLGGLRNGMVAVKKLYSWKDFDNKLFLGEVACIKKAKHKNIARFLAYCVNMQCEVMEVQGKLRIVEEQQRLLCFEYVPNGSLKYYLEGKTHGYEWDVRYQIITGIFQGLQHLHQKRIYHLDLKPSNVLLGAHMEPKITDFGVSRCIDDGEQSVMVTKNIFGTPGYLAPEVIDKQQISAKADIFSLGIIMINILTGRNGGNIENWQENIDVDCSQKKICIELAQICIDSNPHNRPTIDEIIQKLNETETMILKDPTVIREPRNDPESSLYQVVQRFQALSMQTLRENSRIDDIYMELNVLECILEGSKKPSHLSYRFLQFITENFSSERKVDTNLCTEMYKSILRSVAVQRLFTGDTDDGKFHQEVNKMMMLAQHRNIVRFLGYSSYREERQFEKEGTTIVADKCERLLCFEYLSKGRLDNYFSDTSCGLEWKVRYQIIKGICEGLRYIHAKVLLHLDLKPANILLDDNMIPKITRIPYEVFLDTKSYLDGSVGYLAPEFFLGNISFKSDIYSLGVIITEILTGQKESSPTDYVLDIWRQRLTMDGSVTDTLLEQVRACAWISIACMNTDPAKRPNTEVIMDILAQTEIRDKVEKSSSAMPVAKLLSVEEEKAGKVPQGLKQRIMIRVSMQDDKSRAKAVALAARCAGLESVALTGDARDRLEVVGNGIDLITLVIALRRKLGHANIVKIIEEG